MAFSLPLALTEPLSPDELKTYQDILIDRAKASNSRVDVKALEEGFQSSRGEKIPAYEIVLHSLMELRVPKLEAVVRPLTPDLAVNGASPIPREKINVWDYPSENRSDFSAHKGVYLIPPTLQKKDCSECAQKGQATCKQCYGKGQSSCQTCLGAGTQQCHLCKGMGKVVCLKCDGQGKYMSGSLTNKGGANCEACRGAGRLPCGHCSSGRVDCATCNTSGIQSCQKCEGKGKMLCPACRGNMKLVSGLGFQSEFRPSSVSAAALVVGAPKAVLDMALVDKMDVGGVELPITPAFEGEVKESILPPPVKESLLTLLDQTRPTNSLHSRVIRRKADLREGGLVRLSGLYGGREFIYWIHPVRKTVFAEKDIFSNLGASAADEAKHAAEGGDWRKAVVSAKETISYETGNPEARSILKKWERRVLLESLGLSAAAAGVGVIIEGMLIYSQKGLNKTGPFLEGALAVLAIQACVGLVQSLILRNFFDTRRRLISGAGVSAGAMCAFFFLTQIVFNWDPVKTADQSSLEEDIRRNFKNGFSEVYWEKDMVVLQSLVEKYKDSRADISPIETNLEKQKLFKIKLEATTREFRRKIDGIMASNQFLKDKRKLVLEARDSYALQGVDVSFVNEIVKEIDERIKAAARRPEKKGRISITPFNKNYSDVRRAPAGVKSAPSKPAPAKKVKAKKSAAPSHSAKKATDKKKKKKFLFFNTK